MHIEVNLSEYVDLMRKRALGELPQMGSAKRTVEILLERNLLKEKDNKIIDIGCATCHYLRTFMDFDVDIDLYTGVEIDQTMVEAAKDVWANEIKNNKLTIFNSDVEIFNIEKKYNVGICANAFMYFKSPYKAISNIMKHCNNHLLIRGYFSEKSFRILRSQTSSHHDKAKTSEANSFDKEGNLTSFDYWTIYSKEYMESVVKAISPNAKVEWIEDKNYFDSIDKEKNFEVKKRDGTFVLNNMEISYPFIQPWEYLLITL